MPIQHPPNRQSPYAARFARDERRKAQKKSVAERNTQQSVEASKQRQLCKEREASEARKREREREADRRARIERERASRETVEARRRDIEREHALNRRRQELDSLKRLEACEQALRKLNGDVESNYHTEFVRKISLDQYRDSRSCEFKRPGHTDNLREFANTTFAAVRVPEQSRQPPTHHSSVVEYVPQPLTAEQRYRLSNTPTDAPTAEGHWSSASIAQTHHTRRLTAHERLGTREAVRTAPGNAAVSHVPAEGRVAEDHHQLAAAPTSANGHIQYPFKELVSSPVAPRAYHLNRAPRANEFCDQRVSSEPTTPQIQGGVIAAAQVPIARSELDVIRERKTAANRSKNQRRKRLGHAQRTRLKAAIERELRLELNLEKIATQAQPNQKEI